MSSENNLQTTFEHRRDKDVKRDADDEVTSKMLKESQEKMRESQEQLKKLQKKVREVEDVLCLCKSFLYLHDSSAPNFKASAVLS